MDEIYRMRDSLKPEAAYFMESGPFGENTVLIVIEEDRLKDVEKFIEKLDPDFDIAVITPEEFEEYRNVIERGGRKLW